MSRPRNKDPKLAQAIGRRVQAARERRGWTQERLAEMLGVQAETVSRYETGAIPVSVATLMRLADVMNEPVEELLLVKETTAPYGSDEDAEFLSLWRALDPEGRQVVLDLLRRLRPKPSRT